MTLAQLILTIIGLVCFIIGLYHLFRMMVFNIEPPKRYEKFTIFTAVVIIILGAYLAADIYHLLNQIKIF